MSEIRPHLCAVMIAVALVTGCGREGDPQSNKHEAGGHAEAGHGDHNAESPSGASFKAGKGVLVAPETRTILGIEVADVVDRKVPREIPFTVQIFGEKHLHLLNPDDHTGCDVYGSGFLSTNTAAMLSAGVPVRLIKETNRPVAGVVLAVQRALALGESEIVVGISNGAAAFPSGEFVPARITLEAESALPAIPASALLRTAEGTFVYVVNGEAFLRLAVKVGGETEEWVEITDGLLAGDQVVTKPVLVLWLIELRATKGGGHCH